MRVVRVYEPQPLVAGADLALCESASHHLGRVLRAGVGDAVALFNGEGVECSAMISSITKKTVMVHVDHLIPSSTESPLTLHLGQCLSKGERMDYAVQKATELGASSITPLFSERTEVKLPVDRADKRLRHWQQIAISACEQSYRCVVPEVASPVPLSAWMDSVHADLKLVLDPRGAEQLDPSLTPNSVALLIGPEGGLSQAEIDAAVTKGFKAVVLGPRVLRTETAPVAAMAVLQFLWGDWNR